MKYYADRLRLCRLLFFHSKKRINGFYIFPKDTRCGKPHNNILRSKIRMYSNKTLKYFNIYGDSRTLMNNVAREMITEEITSFAVLSFLCKHYLLCNIFELLPIYIC